MRSIAFLLSLVLLGGCASSKNAPDFRTQPSRASAARVSQREPTYKHVVAADHLIASQAGLEMLKKGGNAVDAAVATSFALSVVRPYSCGIGGGGFMLIHLKQHPRIKGLPRTIALDYREVAPSWATPDFFETNPQCRDDPDASTRGAHAVAIPGTVAGLLYALETYGTLPRDVVLAPAIRAAEEGYAVDADYIRATKSPRVTGAPKTPIFDEFRSTYLKQGAMAEGTTLKQPGQAAALRLIARDGVKAFYSGEIAAEIRKILKQGGADVSAAELAAYRPRELAPIVGTYQGKRVFAFPPPSSGGIVLVQTLGMIDARRAEFDSYDYLSSAQTHFLTEAFKHGFADRARFLADPATTEIPTLELTSASNTRELASRIDMNRVQPIESYGSRLPGSESSPKDGGTSHLSVVDSFGNAVACTETINLSFGSLVCVPRFGFVLNDQMDDFTTRRGKPNAFGLRQDDRNLPAPGKQPLSSMCPTILLTEDRDNAPVELVVGGSGGPWIITGTIQVLLDSVTYGLPASKAVAQPRIHHQWKPDTLRIEPEIADSREKVGAKEQTVRAGLEARGQSLKLGKSECVIQAIRRSPSMPGRFEAGSDPRKGGEPAGE
ncbi:MAG: gamma-glutamyltransferase [Planctomycetes bacterium]|nr:gamma-glutamyltransferase [Planctomycetota bacterium]